MTDIMSISRSADSLIKGYRITGRRAQTYLEDVFMKDIPYQGAGISDCFRAQALDSTLMEQVYAYALEYMNSVQDRPVFPNSGDIEGLLAFDEELPDMHSDPHEILKMLHEKGSPATVAQTGGRYFGFVNGGIAPAALATKWLADTWDQNAGMYLTSPVASKLEEVCEKWLKSLLGLPESTVAGFVGGSSTATLCALAAGRNHLLKAMGYDVATQGLFGAPEIKVVLSEGSHSTIYKALSILGLGSERVLKIPMDNQGRIRQDLVPEMDNRTLLILQAGNVNTGSFDKFDSLCEKAKKAGAWVHVDGAFGLWAAASDSLKHLTQGIEKADSWSVDAHKTLNAPYDNGIVLCRDREALTSALSMTGDYIVYSEHRDGMSYTLDMSRRARIVELWATLKSMGRSGVAELTEDLHQKAAYFADELGKKEFQILNEVCFNQVLISAETPELTAGILKIIQNSGELWCGGSQWDGNPVIRLSVCSYRTTLQDIDRCVRAFVKARDEANDGE
jgi:glutamate/tyrosine decarboxylase-like PLP-dependent enzyme